MNIDSSDDSWLFASSSSAAIKELYLSSKHRSPKYSLARLCKDSGIASKGYISDVIHGKKRLNVNLALPVATAFGLKGLKAKYFSLLVQSEHASSDLKREKILDQLDSVRKALQIFNIQGTSTIISNSFAFEVFCSMGLFKGKATMASLLNFFDNEKVGRLEQALGDLAAEGFVTIHDDLVELTATHVRFSGIKSKSQQLEFLKSSIEHAKDNADRWYSCSAESAFESCILSVNRIDYLQKIAKIKADVLHWQSDLETNDADTLIRFNIQIYPVTKTRDVLKLTPIIENSRKLP